MGRTSLRANEDALAPSDSERSIAAARARDYRRWMAGRRQLIAQAIFAAAITCVGTILDIAAADGALSSFVAEYTGGRVVTHDISLPECRIALRAGLRAVHGDALHLPFATGVANLTLAFEILEHFPAWQASHLIEELARVTAPGGLLLLSTPNRYSLESLKGMVSYVRTGAVWNARDSAHQQLHHVGSVKRLLAPSFEVRSVLGYSLTPELRHRPTPWTFTITRNPLLSRMCFDLLVVAERRPATP
jgi:SAM-dependent methyltransferase